MNRSLLTVILLLLAGPLPALASAAEEELEAVSFFEKGNAAYREGQFGEALLWYERALAAAPGFREAEQNRRFLRQRTGSPALEEPSWQEWGGWFSKTAWLNVISFSFWLLVLALAGFFFWSFSAGSRRGLLALALLSLVGLAVGGTGRVAAGKRLSPTAKVIITSETAFLRSAPARSASELRAAVSGTEAKLLAERGPWLYAELPSGDRGWLSTRDATTVWPYDPSLLP
ncbi:MAG: hypothetical protein AAF555_03285 [Verrucomicrobiota bacterium]